MKIPPSIKIEITPVEPRRGSHVRLGATSAETKVDEHSTGADQDNATPKVRTGLEPRRIKSIVISIDWKEWRKAPAQRSSLTDCKPRKNRAKGGYEQAMVTPTGEA